jgi:hypothetical protein
MPRVEFELTIPAFKRAKTVHALDRAATVIDIKPTSAKKLIDAHIMTQSVFQKYVSGVFQIGISLNIR